VVATSEVSIATIDTAEHLPAIKASCGFGEYASCVRWRSSRCRRPGFFRYPFVAAIFGPLADISRRDLTA
jgi:hypothetical protein